MRTYEAMTVRGYQGRLPVGPLPTMKAADYWCMLTMPPVIAAFYLIVEWWPK